MFFFVIFALILLGGLIFTAAGFSQGKGSGIAAGVVSALLLGVIWGFFSFTRVDHREVAIVTEFGRYEATIAEGGVHWLKPWASTERFSTTLEASEVMDVSVSFSDGGNEDGLEEIGGGKGLIDVTTYWQISKDQDNNGAERLWEKYRTFDRVNAFVNKTTRDELIGVANKYPAATAIISQQDIADEVYKEVNNSLEGYGIVIDSVSIPAIDLDPGTQAAVDKLFTTQQDIKRAQNEQVRAEIDAETVRIRQEEGALSPEANQRYCLDVVNAWDVAKNGPLPATFNCAGAGNNPLGVIVDSAPATP